jgi:DnaJ family protein A protein 5
VICRYDSHREQILKGWDGQSATTGYHVGLNADALMQYFSPSCFSGINDGPKGFYTIYRALFAQIESEEEDSLQTDAECVPTPSSDVPHTSFGDSKSGFEQLKTFYNKFCNFSSVKSFRWCDKYRLSDAPDRRVRRLMEKENKKQRDVARREYSEAVRNLMAFVRKRDLRYKAFMEQARLEQEAKHKEQLERMKQEKIERRMQQAQAYEEQDWMKVDKPLDLCDSEFELVSDDGEETPEEELEDIEESTIPQQEEEEEESYYCHACSKPFKSDRQVSKMTVH